MREISFLRHLQRLDVHGHIGFPQDSVHFFSTFSVIACVSLSVRSPSIVTCKSTNQRAPDGRMRTAWQS